MIDRFLKALQFLAWPVATGILLSVVVLQYQQLQQLSERTPLPVARETPSTGLNSFSEAIKHQCHQRQY